MIILNWFLYIAWLSSIVVSFYYWNKDLVLISYRVPLLLVPTVAIIVFSIVFIFNAGSQTVQFTSSLDLWSLWFDWYFPLFFSSFLNLFVAIVIAAVDLLKKRERGVRTFNIIALIATLFTIYHVIPRMPDA